MLRYLIVLGIVIALTFCTDHGATKYKCVFDPVPQIEFVFVHDHPFLAEYKKEMMDGNVSYHIGVDPGGQAEIHVYEDDGNYIVVTQKCEWITIDKKSFVVSLVQKEFESVIPGKYYGRYEIDKGKNGNRLKFVKAMPGEFQKPHILKGG